MIKNVCPCGFCIVDFLFGYVFERINKTYFLQEYFFQRLAAILPVYRFINKKGKC
jgi:hypothetical protein